MSDEPTILGPDAQPAPSVEEDSNDQVRMEVKLEANGMGVALVFNQPIEQIMMPLDVTINIVLRLISAYIQCMNKLNEGPPEMGVSAGGLD